MAREQKEQELDGTTGQELCGLDEACTTLGVSRSTLTRWLAEGRLRGMKVGRQWRFRRTDLEKFGQMAHPSAAAVNIAELDAVIAQLPVNLELSSELDPALTNYPNTEEEKALERLFLALLTNAATAGASDLHLDAAHEHTTVRQRLDGVLHEVCRLPRSAHRALVACVKYHAEMAADQVTTNQDGIFRLRVGENSFHVRVATIPAVFGETMVLRFLSQNHQLVDLDRIGMSPEDKERYFRALIAPCGLVIATGPTGSGKTTVLYSGMQRIISSERKMLTVEDPVEVILPGVTQIPVNRKAGLTFEHTVRALLRQDPDIIMVGGLDNLAVAETCIQAAITGHLVLSQLHAPTAAAAVLRLLDMGLEPFLLAESLLCVVATRLARRVCPQCAERDELSFSVLSPLAEQARAGGYLLPDDATFLRGKGCDHCRGTGYRGRLGLYEVLELNEDLARLLLARAPAKDLQAAAVKHGMTTLAADGLRKAAQGLTTVPEVARVTHVFSEP